MQGKLLRLLAVEALSLIVAAIVPADGAGPPAIGGEAFLLVPTPLLRNKTALPIWLPAGQGGIPFAHAADPCPRSIAAAETRYSLPTGLLYSIGLVESGRLDSRDGSRQPWPWAADIDGKPQFYNTKQEAVAGVAAILRSGSHSVDVGCMQVNLKQHPEAFASLNDAFEPASNADYAARFLISLHAGGVDWIQAAGLYHSSTPILAEPYRRQVESSYAGLAITPTPMLASTRPSLARAIPHEPHPSAELLVDLSELRLRAANDARPLAAARMLAIAHVLDSITGAEASRVARRLSADTGVDNRPALKNRSCSAADHVRLVSIRLPDVEPRPPRRGSRDNAVTRSGGRNRSGDIRCQRAELRP
jgi:hypothetical protein